MYFCCRRDNNYDQLDEPNSEASPLVRNGNGSLVDGVIASRRSATDDLNLWTNPDDVTHSISEDDQLLSEMLDERRKATTRESELMWHQKVEEVRKVRKKLQDRWKRVLMELGFADEQTNLVAVSSVTKTAAPNTSVKAYYLHDVLVRETSIFGDGPVQRHRYAVILDRLRDLDITDDFLEAAKELFPKKIEKPKRHKKAPIRETDERTGQSEPTEFTEETPKSPENGSANGLDREDLDTKQENRAENTVSK
ncbi:melanoregulin-like [Asterias amurensis]|uniref:melanoregulin-like n=1 Tax=Asterias amurensis TaxID=7602 RepID=UPI003AB75EFC